MRSFEKELRRLMQLLYPPLYFMGFPLQAERYCIAGRWVEIFVPDAAAVKEAWQGGNISFPYWAQVWPAAIGLSSFLVEHPYYIQGKGVLELGAGLGLPSVVAASYAAAVVCTDAVAEAIAVVRQSARHNNLANLEVGVLNWDTLPEDVAAPVLLLSDVNYDPAVFALQHKMIGKFLQKGTVVILSTPQRLVAKPFVAQLLPLCTRQEAIAVTHNGKEETVTVMVLNGQ